MTNQANQYDYKVAECWSSSSPKRKVLVLADSQQKSMYFENHPSFIRWVDNQASESKINSLKERVAELQSHLSSQSIEIAKNDVTLESYAHKVEALQVDNNRLREALETISDWRFGWEGDCGVTSVANNTLSSTPAQSLVEHDNDVIERIATALENAEGELKTLPEYVALVRGMKNE